MRPVQLRIETQRMNGYRRPGYFYLIGERVPYQCCSLPFQLSKDLLPLHGLQPVPEKFHQGKSIAEGGLCLSQNCPNAIDPRKIAGMMWVPENEYRFAAFFFSEIRTQPVQMLLQNIDWQKLPSLVGSYILLAHRKAIVDYSDGPLGWVDSHTLEANTTVKYFPGIFAMFVVTGIEYVIGTDKPTNSLKNVYKQYQKMGVEIVHCIAEESLAESGNVTETLKIPLE